MARVISSTHALGKDTDMQTSKKALLEKAPYSLLFWTPDGVTVVLVLLLLTTPRLMTLYLHCNAKACLRQEKMY